jgi:peroxiredoxin
LPGTKLSLPDVEWPHAERTVVLALSTTCHFCTESAAFYRQLLKKRGNVPVIAVLPQATTESKKYLDRLNLRFDETKQINLESIGVEGTPTLIVLDGHGAVIESWVGKLSDTEQSNVLRRVLETVGQS